MADNNNNTEDDGNNTPPPPNNIVPLKKKSKKKKKKPTPPREPEPQPQPEDPMTIDNDPPPDEMEEVGIVMRQEEGEDQPITIDVTPDTKKQTFLPQDLGHFDSLDELNKMANLQTGNNLSDKSQETTSTLVNGAASREATPLRKSTSSSSAASKLFIQKKTISVSGLNMPPPQQLSSSSSDRPTTKIVDFMTPNPHPQSKRSGLSASSPSLPSVTTIPYNSFNHLSQNDSVMGKLIKDHINKSLPFDQLTEKNLADEKKTHIDGFVGYFSNLIETQVPSPSSNTTKKSTTTNGGGGGSAGKQIPILSRTYKMGFLRAPMASDGERSCVHALNCISVARYKKYCREHGIKKTPEEKESHYVLREFLLPNHLREVHQIFRDNSTTANNT